jgi:hypothetical protein
MTCPPRHVDHLTVYHGDQARVAVFRLAQPLQRPLGMPDRRSKPFLDPVIAAPAWLTCLHSRREVSAIPVVLRSSNFI